MKKNGWMARRSTIISILSLMIVFVMSMSMFAYGEEAAAGGNGVANGATSSESANDAANSENADSASNDGSSNDATSNGATANDAASGENSGSDNSGSTGGTSGATTMKTHEIEWVSGSSGVTFDGDKAVMDVTPEHNNAMKEQYAELKVKFSKGGNDPVPVGAAEIRIPAHIMVDREGNPVGDVIIPLAKAPEEVGNTGFNYYIDEETDEIVMKNFRELEGSYFFETNIRYANLNPLQIRDGDVNNKIQATFTIKND